MWAKFSGALKQRPGTPAADADDDDHRPPTSPTASQADVLAGVYEQHPNLSVFHEPSEIPFPSPSTPASPSKHARKGMFKRPKVPKFDPTADQPPQPPQPPMKLSLALPKKVKSSLHTISTASESSLNRTSQGSSSTHSADSRPSVDSARTFDEAKPISPITPITPTTTEGRFGSLRSILRDRHTPATGQSVRFFSRDAYKVISPDSSAVSSVEPDDTGFAMRLQRSTPVRPAAQDLFSTPQAQYQGPQTDPSNIFDLSQENELPNIPTGAATPLLDSAIELLPEDSEVVKSMELEEQEQREIEAERPSTPVSKSSSPSVHDRSHSFSFGQTVFSLTGVGGGESSKARAGSLRAKASRSRALSDTVFATLGGTPPPARPEADINDVSAPVVYAPAAPGSPEKDPFGAHATTYYTPGTVPPTPRSASASAHNRTASREEDALWSLRTQVALHAEMCAQYQVDLGAREAQLRTLGAHLEDARAEAERRRTAVKGWRRRVAELERCVRALEDEVERSREESAERSMMDEASGEALRMLHRQIAALERERAEGARREQQAREEHAESEEALRVAREELAKRDTSERELKDGIRAAREEMEQMGALGTEQAAGGEDARAAWEEERARLLADNEALRQEQAALQTQLDEAREEVLRGETDAGVLKAELEAQWKNTESMGEELKQLAEQRDGLQADVDALQERITSMEDEWTQAENRVSELEGELQEVWAAKEEAERERSELEDQLRTEQGHAEDLTHALQEREDRLTALEREQQYSRDTALRLETRIRQQEQDAVALGERAAAREKEAEAAQEEMARMKREHARTVNEQSRTLQEVVAREVGARAGHETLVREKAEADVLLGTLRERVNALQEEAERLRRQVHALQQESADKEVRIANFVKQRSQDKEDLNGLNIALDSKQQELELLKRKMGVRGTAGNTPAASKVAPGRRESSIFGTPSVSNSRPPSVLSDVESTVKARKMETPITSTRSTLGKAARPGSHLAAKRSLDGAMGPPPSVSRASASSSASASATPTRIPSSGSTRSSLAGSSVTPSSFKVTPIQRRPSASSATGEPSRLRSTVGGRERLTSASETDEKEKENAAPAVKAARRMSAMPA